MIIYKPTDKTISKDILESAYKANRDGWGMMALDDNGTPFSVKTPKEIIVGQGFEEFYNEYMLNFAHRECAIHFRMRTSGEVDLENTHPYEVVPGTYVMHNGVITIHEHDKTKSDTWHFARTIEEMVEGGLIRKEGFKNLCEMAIGTGNKLVFLDRDGFVFINRKQGSEYYGCWFSNDYAWDSPFSSSYHGYYDWTGEGYSGTGGRFPGSYRKFAKSGYRESYSTGSDGSVERTVWLPDGSKVLLGSTSTGSTTAVAQNKEQILDEIAQTVSKESFEKLSCDEQARYFGEAEDRLTKAEMETTENHALVATALAVSSRDEEEEIVVNRIIMPQTIGEWAELEEEQIKELNYEEPDMIAEAFFQALHLVEE